MGLPPGRRGNESSREESRRDPDKTAEATLTETCYKLFRRAIVRGLTPERNRFCLALQVIAKTRP
jgi:hypothetical protein